MAAFILFFASSVMAFIVKSIGALWILTVGSGLSYGVISTIGPSLVSRVWGEADFGRNFGILWSSKQIVVIKNLLTLEPTLIPHLYSRCDRTSLLRFSLWLRL
jgi:hypothetical protein